MSCLAGVMTSDMEEARANRPPPGQASHLRRGSCAARVRSPWLCGCVVLLLLHS